MRVIEVSTEVFALIWSLRQEGEESEDVILKRVLAAKPKLPILPKPGTKLAADGSKVTWVDDVQSALKNVGAPAHLSRIYNEVIKIRRAAGRSLPVNTQAIIRRTLEDNCRGSQAFKGRALFEMAEGKGAGVWGIAK